MGHEALEEGREGSGVSSGDPGGVRRARRGWESLPKGQEDQEAFMEGWEGSGVPSGEPGIVGREAEDGRPFRRPGGVRRPSRRAGRGLEALLAGRERWGGVGRPIQMVGWFGSPPTGPGGVGSLTRGSGGIVRPTRRARRVWGPSVEP